MMSTSASSTDENKIAFLKIDVQGYELEVLKGAKNILQNKKADFVLFELSKLDLDNGLKSIKFMQDVGYVCFET